MDQGEVIEFKDSFHQLMKAAAERLHIAEHKVLDKNNSQVSLYSCVESKGIVGSDGRNYILDLVSAKRAVCRVQFSLGSLGEHRIASHRAMPTTRMRRRIRRRCCGPSSSPTSAATRFASPCESAC
mgnify:CR=1 FL=1